MTTEQTSVASCCVTGHIHEGNPLGNFEVHHGLRTYVSDPKPPTDGGKQTVVIIVPDIFGVDLVNTKLVADSWAQNGWKVMVPDVFEGDAVSHTHLKAIVPNMRDKEKATIATKAANAAEMAAALGPWLVKHREAAVKPLVEKFFDGVRADPKTDKIIAVGYCWGARYCFLMAQEPSKVDVVIANHPSFVTNADLENVKGVPTALLKGDQDDMCTDDALNEYAAILRRNSSATGDDTVSVKIYPNAVHGFAVRGDDMIESEKKQKEDAADVGIQFAKKFV